MQRNTREEKLPSLEPAVVTWAHRTSTVFVFFPTTDNWPKEGQNTPKTLECDARYRWGEASSPTDSSSIRDTYSRKQKEDVHGEISTDHASFPKRSMVGREGRVGGGGVNICILVPNTHILLSAVAQYIAQSENNEETLTIVDIFDLN